MACPSPSWVFPGRAGVHLLVKSLRAGVHASQRSVADSESTQNYLMGSIGAPEYPDRVAAGCSASVAQSVSVRSLA